MARRELLKLNNMKSINISLLALLLLSTIAYSQKEVKYEFDATNIKEVNIQLEFPELVKLKSWDGDKVRITGSAMVNMGAHDDNFEIEANREPGRLFITSQIRDIGNIPHKVWAKQEDGTIRYFDSPDWRSEEVQKYLDENPGHRSISNGVIKQIALEIYVPKNMALTINCKYGLLEIKDFDAPLNANSKFGGIDITFSAKNRIDVSAKTKFGEVYSNLDIEFKNTYGSINDHNNWLVLESKFNNGGLSYTLKSEHGDLFLRKN